MNKEQFLKTQKIASQFFCNARKHSHLPHAILLFGDKNAPVKDVASFLAKSLRCNKDILACDNCSGCQEYDESKTADFYIIDGSSTIIKKDEINDLSDNFVLKSKDEKQAGLYLIYEIANITGPAANALLKFLEEPPEGVQAILTTTVREKVLPTILSRVVSLRVLPVTQEYEEGLIDSKALMVLSSYNLTQEETINLAANKDFNKVFLLANEFIETLIFNYNKGIHLLFSKIADQLKDSTCYNYLYSIIYQVFLSVGASDENCAYRDAVIGLKKHKEEIIKAADFLEEIISSSRLNFNFTLVLGRLAVILGGR